MDDVARLAVDLAATANNSGKRLRGIMAKHLNVAAADAKANALSSWTKYGQGEAGAAGTIRARMSRSVGSRGGTRQLGYLLADGQGAFQSEHGTHDRAPDPVMGQAVERIADAFTADAGKQLPDRL